MATRRPASSTWSIDAAAGPIYSARRTKEPSFLKPKEVVLTFDDGPMPWITKSILDTLDRYCTEGTFFEVGRMAVTYPGMVREVLGRGHRRRPYMVPVPTSICRACRQPRRRTRIEKDLAAVALAGQPIAPFFRFTGLSDSDPPIGYADPGIASFTVDIVSNDSYIRNAGKLAHETLKRVEEHNGGVVLFHDIKAAHGQGVASRSRGVAEARIQGRAHARRTAPRSRCRIQRTAWQAVAKALVDW